MVNICAYNRLCKHSCDDTLQTYVKGVGRRKKCRTTFSDKLSSHCSLFDSFENVTSFILGFVFCFRESQFHVKNFIPSQTKASLGYLTRSLDNMMHAIKFYSSKYLAMREFIASSE